MKAEFKKGDLILEENDHPHPSNLNWPNSVNVFIKNDYFGVNLCQPVAFAPFYKKGTF